MANLMPMLDNTIQIFIGDVLDIPEGYALSNGQVVNGVTTANVIDRFPYCNTIGTMLETNDNVRTPLPARGAVTTNTNSHSHNSTSTSAHNVYTSSKSHSHTTLKDITTKAQILERNSRQLKNNNSFNLREWSGTTNYTTSISITDSSPDSNGSHSHGFSGSTTAGVGGNGAHEHNISGGDPETRPRHVLVLPVQFVGY